MTEFDDRTPHEDRPCQIQNMEERYVCKESQRAGTIYSACVHEHNLIVSGCKEHLEDMLRVIRDSKVACQLCLQAGYGLYMLEEDEIELGHRCIIKFITVKYVYEFT